MTGARRVVTKTVWRLAAMPDQTGRRVVVTGPSVGGLGHHVALEFARRGAAVTLAGRNEPKLKATEAAIRDEVPDADLQRLVLDLADLTAVRRAAEEVESVDVLVNNAGVMAPPYTVTADGLELQMATNHFGPFLLTGLLLPLLRAAGEAGRDARIVTVSSLMHRSAKSAPLGDPRLRTERYARWPTYAASKLANLLFTYELDRRLHEVSAPVRALAAHPGVAGTHLVANGQLGRAGGGVASILDAAVKAVTQTPAAGALPVLMAATADLPGATYCGPSGFREARGLPTVVESTALARDEVAARRLWELSEDVVGLTYP